MTRATLRNTVAIYDPKGSFGEDFEAYVDVPAKKR